MKRLFYSMLGAVFVGCGLWLGSLPAYAQFSYFPALYNGPEGLCRLGINDTERSLQSYPIQPLRLGWHIDYTAVGPDVPGLDYFPVIRLEQTANGYNYSFRSSRQPVTEAQLRAQVASMPGNYWIIGNEPDRIRFQDDMEPDVYARAYHDLYQIIKDADPTAKLVAGAIVQPTDVRLTYLDLVLQSYYDAYKTSMPVDGWAFHNFILNEASCSYYGSLEPPLTKAELEQICWGADIPPGVNATDGLRIDVQDNDRIDLFKEQVIRFRQWMADRGYRNTPAFLSEFGILMPEGLFNPDFTVERVNTFMDQSFDFLLNTTDPEIGYPADNNRLVQRFAWYSVDDKVNHNGFLFDPALPTIAGRTGMGDNFAEYANSLNESVDFYVDNVALIGAPPLASQGATTVTLEAVIGNSGNLASARGTTVHFYNGNPSSGGVPIASAQSVSLPGCGEQGAVRVEWGDVAPGNYTIYVQVAAESGDLDPSNNQGRVAVNFYAENLFMPAMKRELSIPE